MGAAVGAAAEGAPEGAAVGTVPVGGKAGSLMVGDDVGLGGNAMRTVSFFGCTLTASTGFGGTPPDGGMGGLGVGSAINYCRVKVWVGKNGVKPLFPESRHLGAQSSYRAGLPFPALAFFASSITFCSASRGISS